MSTRQTKIINLSWSFVNEAELMDTLEGLSKKGWRLVGNKKPNYLKLWQPSGFLFEKGEPEDRVYRADYRYGSKADIKDYTHLCEEAGWKNVFVRQSFYIFSAPADLAAQADFFSDQDSKIAKYKRLRLRVLILGAVFTPILFYFYSFLQGTVSTESSVIPTIFTVYVLYLIYVVIRLSLNIRTLEIPQSETHQGKTKRTGAKRLTAELNGIAVLTLLFMPISAYFFLPDWHWSLHWHIAQSVGLLSGYLVLRLFIILHAKAQRLP
jgi:Protein of unknown function (DUF2812)